MVSNLNNYTNKAVFAHLRDVSTEFTISLYKLMILLEDHRLALRDKKHTNKQVYPLQIGDIIKAHVQVQSVANKLSLVSFLIRLKDHLPSSLTLAKTFLK